ncbi:SDR family oxidoreductase, partial [Micrococcus sp. KRD070]
MTLRQAQGPALGGLVAIVTGGASGIGAAIATRLHADGAQIAVLDRDTSGADERFAAFTADVSDRASVDAAVAGVADKFGRIDIVVNNAGIGAIGDISANDDEEWARVLSVNVTGIARVTAAALPWLRRSPAAAVCNTASIASST